ncbi:hypothetical protein PT974_05724 [Cladobotryum mycophilum]|uniref:Uncharacterized protein n=1 Tax=Cladobotryum mycophilum TaxID=491253 RepID=A0ABR0SJJ6_9HYPO
METSVHNITSPRPSDLILDLLLISIICLMELFLGPVFACFQILSMLHEKYTRPAISTLTGRASLPNKWLRNRYGVVESVSQV